MLRRGCLIISVIFRNNIYSNFTPWLVGYTEVRKEPGLELPSLALFFSERTEKCVSESTCLNDNVSPPLSDGWLILPSSVAVWNNYKHMWYPMWLDKTDLIVLLQFWKSSLLDYYWKSMDIKDRQTDWHYYMSTQFHWCMKQAKIIVGALLNVNEWSCRLMTVIMVISKHLFSCPRPILDIIGCSWHVSRTTGLSQTTLFHSVCTSLWRVPKPITLE